MLVTVDSFREPWEAHLFKMRLEAEDIPAFVRLEYHIWMFWPYSTALGGARVQVPVHLQETACEIRELCKTDHFKGLLEQLFGDIDDVHCPYCSSRNFRKRTTTFVAVAATLFMTRGGMFPARATKFDCQDCGRRRRLRIPVYEALLTTGVFTLAAAAFQWWISGAASPLQEHGPQTYPFSRYPTEFPAK